MDPISATLMVASTALKVGGSLAEGAAAEDAANYEAQQLERNANARMAEATGVSYEAGREGRILQSDARAAMVAGGGSATDAGATEIIGKIGRDSAHNVLAALFTGRSESDTLKDQANARRYEGKMAKRKATISAISSAIEGASSFMGPPGAAGKPTPSTPKSSYRAAPGSVK